MGLSGHGGSRLSWQDSTRTASSTSEHLSSSSPLNETSNDNNPNKMVSKTLVPELFSSISSGVVFDDDDESDDHERQRALGYKNAQPTKGDTSTQTNSPAGPADTRMQGSSLNDVDVGGAELDDKNSKNVFSQHMAPPTKQQYFNNEYTVLADGDLWAVE